MKIGNLLLRFISLILGIEEGQNFPPPLSKAEETELFLMMAEGDNRARDKIIEHNLFTSFQIQIPVKDFFLFVCGGGGNIKIIDYDIDINEFRKNNPNKSLESAFIEELTN